MRSTPAERSGLLKTVSYPEVAPPVRGRIEGLDGLRAVAVGLVLAFHLWPETVPGGFVGVDVFFVLSGFLITTRLAVELQATGRIDLTAFWLRRARRLLPALVLVVVVSTAIASLVDSDLLVDIARQVFGAFTFSTNWVEISAGTDYFANGESQLLNPLWSLAVEEQFYLLWPAAFTLLAARRVTRQRSAGISLIVAGLSAVLMATMLTSAFDSTRVYYGTDTHIFGLMIGVALAYRMADPASGFHRPQWVSARSTVGIAGLASLLIVLTTLGSSTRWTYQGGLVSASILTALVVATLPGERTMVVDLLDRTPMRWVGQRSYGIYLWHWPVLLIVRAALPARPPGAVTDARTAFLALAVTAAVSAASYRFVELPIHRNGFQATFAQWREKMMGEPTRPDASRVGPNPMPASLRVLAVPTIFVALIVLALAAVVTAPKISEAQRSVEEGQRMIAAQLENAPVPTVAAVTPAVVDRSAVGSDNSTETAAQAQSAPVGAELIEAPFDIPVSPGSVSGADESQPGATEATQPTNQDATPGEIPTPTPPEPATLPPTVAPAITTPQPAVAQPPAVAAIDGSGMVGLGDSVLSGAAPAMFAQFPGMRLVAVPNRQWGDAPSMIDELLAQGELRDVVVLNFGTNAGLVDDARLQAVRDTFERIGPNRRVIVVTIVGISRWVPPSNANLVQIAAEYPNVTVVDWNAAVQNDPGLVHSDRTHPNMRGIAVYANMIANALG